MRTSSASTAGSGSRWVVNVSPFASAALRSVSTTSSITAASSSGRGVTRSLPFWTRVTSIRSLIMLRSCRALRRQIPRYSRCSRADWPREAVEHDREQLVQRSERRAQLVRDVGEELGPHAQRIARGAPRVLEALVHLHDRVVMELVAQRGADPRVQHLGNERLGHIVVGARFEPAHDVIGAVERGRHQHRDRRERGVRLQSLTGLESVHVRHQDFEQDQVQGLGARAIERLGASPRGRDREADPLELAREQRAAVLAVVDDQDLRHRGLQARKLRAARSRRSRAWAVSLIGSSMR